MFICRPVRVVAWAEGEKQFMTVTDTFASKPCQVNIFDFSEDLSNRKFGVEVLNNILKCSSDLINTPYEYYRKPRTPSEF